MHRLLGRVLRERDHAEGRCADTVEAALDLLEPRLFDVDRAWPMREAGTHLVAQIAAVWSVISQADGVSQELLLRGLAARSWAVWQLHATTDDSRTLDLAADTAADSERIVGTDHPQTLLARYHLAHAYQSADRQREAADLLDQTLADGKRVLAPGDPLLLDLRTHEVNHHRYDQNGLANWQMVELLDQIVTDADARLAQATHT